MMFYKKMADAQVDKLDNELYDRLKEQYEASYDAKEWNIKLLDEIIEERRRIENENSNNKKEKRKLPGQRHEGVSRKQQSSFECILVSGFKWCKDYIGGRR